MLNTDEAVALSLICSLVTAVSVTLCRRKSVYYAVAFGGSAFSSEYTQNLGSTTHFKVPSLQFNV